MTMMSSNDFLFASIHEVVETLVVAIILVILVVYFFLQDFKSTLIPSISIIVSLVGTFAAMQMAGFSINILTLFALVLVIGTVVDDSSWWSRLCKLNLTWATRPPIWPPKTPLPT